MVTGKPKAGMNIMGRFLSMDVLDRSKGLLTEKRGNVSHVFIQQTLLEYQLLTRFWGSEKMALKMLRN